MGKVRGKSSAKKASRKPKMLIPEKPLPVTLLSGFLGSGKTTLLQHILRSEHGLRIAVVVNDIGAINVDASLIKQTHRITKTNEKVIALQNGCICCTLRGDLLEELVRLSQLQAFDYIIIESSGISEPEQVAETFDSRLAEQMDAMGSLDGEGLDEDMLRVLKQLKEAGGLEKFARLDTTVTVIDAFTMLHDFDTGDLISSRRDDVTPEDERTVSDLMVDQIEFAEVIILNKTDMIGSETKTRLLGLIKKLNHRANIIEASYGRVDVKEIVNTGRFSLSVAQTGYGWLQDLHEMTLREPETEEYNVRSFIYSRTRPFHPRRLWALLYDKFILQLEHPDDEDDEDDGDEDEEDLEMADYQEGEDAHDSIEKGGGGSSSSGDKHSAPSSPQSAHSTVQTVPSPSLFPKGRTGETLDEEMLDSEELLTPPNEVILENKRQHPTLARLFRSKGEFLLATRPHRCGDWSQAGAMLTMRGGRPWFCTLPPEEYLTGEEEIDALVRNDIEKGGEWGDRRQELVFIGEKLNHTALETMLDECLLNDAEFSEWEGVMRDGALSDIQKREALEELFDDGFPDWFDDEDAEDHEGHDHSHPHIQGIRSLS
ncbi:Fc.00g012350.m01.CDS01 [Cosmosporella sp. VM-42]